MDDSAETAPDPGRGARSADAGSDPRTSLLKRYQRVREATERLVDDLRDEDQNLQSMPEVSPAKWHRAHTTWFFETFILERHDPEHRPYDPAFAELFNSYYNAIGRQHPRARRALISRPDATEVGRYREAVDEAMTRLIERADEALAAELAPLVELGLNHEQQHQELLLTDLKHAFSFNPLAPRIGTGDRVSGACAIELDFVEYEAGMTEVGARGDAFCFDNERPRHRVWLPNRFALADRPVNCGEYAEFIADGGYENPLLWLSDGWAWVREHDISAPLYWQRADNDWQVMTLAGPRVMDPAEPVCHVSFYEACAFAEWAGCRLPTEAEWEHAASRQPVDGHFADRGRWHPAPRECGTADGPAALYGDVWEWTASSYGPYPGFQPAAGAIGEYNGKFMANQMVLRGGSCATPAGHVRATYRNFFYPPDRWQFSGLRLAKDTQ